MHKVHSKINYLQLFEENVDLSVYQKKIIIQIFLFDTMTLFAMKINWIKFNFKVIFIKKEEFLCIFVSFHELF